MTVDTRLPALPDTYWLAEPQVSAFRANGHIRLSGVATPQEVSAYGGIIATVAHRHNSETRPLSERDTYGRAFLQIENLWRLDDDVRRFVTAPRFAGIAARLLGVPHVRLYHDQALFKEAGGGPTPWHQDSVYWPLDTDKTVTMWMPLVDLDQDMGGMVFASGSHTARELASYGISDDSDAYFDQLLAGGRFAITDPPTMRAGDATFHCGWTLHRALPNQSQTVREVMTIIYVADGTRVAAPHYDWHRKEYDRWLPGLQPGDLVDTPLNPILV